MATYETLDEALGAVARVDGPLAESLGAFFGSRRTRRDLSRFADALASQALARFNAARSALDPAGEGVPSGFVAELLAPEALAEARRAYEGLLLASEVAQDALIGADAVSGWVPVLRGLARRARNAPVPSAEIEEAGRALVGIAADLLLAAQTMERLAPQFESVRELGSVGGALASVARDIAAALLRVVKAIIEGLGLGKVLLVAGVVAGAAVALAGAVWLLRRVPPVPGVA